LPTAACSIRSTSLNNAVDALTGIDTPARQRATSERAQWARFWPTGIRIRRPKIGDQTASINLNEYPA
jgi:hypothetical protein